MASQEDDSKIDDTLQDSKTELLLKTAESEITRKHTKVEKLNNSNSDIMMPKPPDALERGDTEKTEKTTNASSDSSSEAVPKPPESLERGDTTVGDFDKTTKASNNGGRPTKASNKELHPNSAGNKSSPSDFSSERSEHSSALNDTSARSTRSVGKSLDTSARSARSIGPGRSIGTNESRSPAQIFGKPRFTRAGMLGLISSDDERSTETPPVRANYTRGRRRSSLGAYKVPGVNKPKGPQFVTVKRRHQPKGFPGVVDRPRRFSSSESNGPISSNFEASSDDFVPPPPPRGLDMSQSMAIAIAQLKEDRQQQKKEHEASKVEPRLWLYMTAAFTLFFSTGGLLTIILYAFGAAFGNVYQDARRSLEYLSPTGSLDDPSTPQYAALQWLVRKDRANGLDLVDDTVRREARYSLAVLFHSTEGELRWNDQLNFLSEKHECDWNREVEVDDDEGGKKSARVGVICDGNRNIVELAMISNNVRGQLPSELSALSGLVSLSFKDNELSGTIPDWKWDGLESLYLQNNEFEGSVPTSLWTQYSSLKILDLSSNELSSSLPREMSDLTSIESINLGYNQLTGTIALSPNDFREYEDGDNNTVRTLIMPTLRSFNVTNNKMRGTLDFVELFPSLQVLDVTHNSMTGRIPGILGGLTSLNALYLSDNEFFGAIPSAIGSLTNLATITASNNALNRQFPWDSFDGNNTLTELVFSGNSLTGSLPTNMGTFSSLQVLDFGSNLLSGRIDPSIARDIALRILRLSRNQLEGPLPSEPEALPNTLEIIDLHSNRLAGEMPVSWASLTSLNVLTLHDNLFVGDIPGDWIQMSSLERLTLHLNQLAGSVEFMCEKQPQPAITANCAGFEPQVECSCCILCLE